MYVKKMYNLGKHKERFTIFIRVTMELRGKAERKKRRHLRK